MGGPIEKRSGRTGHRVQPLQRCQTDQIVRSRAILLQFRVVERHCRVAWFIAVATEITFLIVKKKRPSHPKSSRNGIVEPAGNLVHELFKQ